MNKNIVLNNKFFIVIALLEKTGNQIFSKFGLTVKTYAILVAINGGCTKSTELAKNIQGSKASVTQKTKWLEEEGLIYRKLDKKDKRIWYFYLTDKGKETIKMVVPDYEKAMNNLFEPFSKKEIGQMIKMFEIMEGRLHHAIKHNIFSKNKR
ncbi:MAG TPA: hypothetical protein DCP02_06190 [Actinobacteria bacterium]|nr:hypothetical protein [Actinomycetota bacterium]